MTKEKINWETFSKSEIEKLDDLAEITSKIRLMLAAYLRTQSQQSDRHVFSEEIRKLAHEIENWVDDYEMPKM